MKQSLSQSCVPSQKFWTKNILCLRSNFKYFRYFSYRFAFKIFRFASKRTYSFFSLFRFAHFRFRVASFRFEANEGHINLFHKEKHHVP